MKQMLTVLGGAAAALLIAAGAWLAFVYSGFYDVAASREHSALTEWTLETISERSIERRAGELPAALPTDPGALLHGLEHYRAMCQVCHAAPGIDRSEIGAGLHPRPPRLERAAAEWSDAELFWIVKHGITATGMPAFGATHDDAELLQIVALLRRFSEMTPAQYADMVAALDSAGIAGHRDTPADSPAAPPHVDRPGTAPHAH